MQKIILFYKRLIAPGGAERLLMREYRYFKERGYEVIIVTFELKDGSLFNETVEANDIALISSSNAVVRIIKLTQFFKDHKDGLFICSSGYVDFYFASLLSGINYSMHIHQPSFMSFNETDKYSVFMRKAFNKLVYSNYGASRFIEIKKNLSLIQKIKINLRAIVSIRAVKKAKNVFVLSNYAKNEKRETYNIDAHSICGALSDEDFNYIPKEIKEYKDYKYKLLTVARLDINKRIDELIVGFSMFLKDEPNSILLIGGRGDQFDNLNSIANKLGISENVKFLGFIADEELYDYYALADLFVSIDWADFRITSYEAMVLGTKVLLSDETDPYKNLLDSGYYYLCKPKAIETYAAIKKALENHSVYPKEKLNLILKEYTWRNYFMSIEQILTYV